MLRSKQLLQQAYDDQAYHGKVLKVTWEAIEDFLSRPVKALPGHVESVLLSLPVTTSEPSAQDFVLGAFTISPSQTPGKVFIRHESGEGGDFDKEALTAWVAKFYWENF